MFLLQKDWIAPSGWSLYLLDVLPTAFGWPGFFLAIGGLVLAVLSDVAVGLVLASSALAAIALVAPATALFVRYAAPAIPPLAVGLGLSLCAPFALAARGDRRWLAAGAVALGLGLVTPVGRTLLLDRLMASTDTREVAGRRLAELGPGATARAEGWFAQVYLLDEQSAAACAAEIPQRLNLGIPVMASNAVSRWPAAIARGEEGWGAIANDAGEAYIFRPPPPAQADYVFDGFGTLPCGRYARREARRLDPECFELVDVIQPGGLACDAYVDMFDAFWLPFRGFKGQLLPGPEIQIFHNNCKSR
jgi:hypothetical protein